MIQLASQFCQPIRNLQINADRLLYAMLAPYPPHSRATRRMTSTLLLVGGRNFHFELSAKF